MIIKLQAVNGDPVIERVDSVRGCLRNTSKYGNYFLICFLLAPPTDFLYYNASQYILDQQQTKAEHTKTAILSAANIHFIRNIHFRTIQSTFIAAIHM